MTDLSLRRRCQWVNLANPRYIAYHDEEWGLPVHDDTKLFEFLILESFQAGLSWQTILRKRHNFAKAFANFDYHQIARFTLPDNFVIGNVETCRDAQRTNKSRWRHA